MTQHKDLHVTWRYRWALFLKVKKGPKFLYAFNGDPMISPPGHVTSTKARKNGRRIVAERMTRFVKYGGPIMTVRGINACQSAPRKEILTVRFEALEN